MIVHGKAEGQGSPKAARRSSAGLLDAGAPGESLSEMGEGAGGHRFVCVAEFDRFTALRQRLGYATSNALIGELTERLREALPGCNLGRAGRTSVEFAFAAGDGDSARAALLRAVARIERPFWVDDIDFDLNCTIGAVDAGERPIDDRLLDAAVAALRRAQDVHEKIRLEQVDAATADTVDELSLTRDLRRAIRQDQLNLHYQPKLRARTDTVDSAEALLRWTHPEHGRVRIDKLIELAEATGAIRELTLWGIDRALADRQVLADAGHPLTIFVNISGILLPDTAFADWALARLRDAKGAIGFEITETAVIEDPTVAIRNLQRFAEAGIRIAIDDYGSGLSSLAYLKQLPANELKIDRMFVKGLTESQRDPLLVRSSIDLAHALEMEVTAEGVDDRMSASLLRIMGCDLLQGYLISPPLPLADLRRFLDESRHRDAFTAKPSGFAGWDSGKNATSFR